MLQGPRHRTSHDTTSLPNTRCPTRKLGVQFGTDLRPSLLHSAPPTNSSCPVVLLPHCCVQPIGRPRLHPHGSTWLLRRLSIWTCATVRARRCCPPMPPCDAPTGPHVDPVTPQLGWNTLRVLLPVRGPASTGPCRGGMHPAGSKLLSLRLGGARAVGRAGAVFRKQAYTYHSPCRQQLHSKRRSGCRGPHRLLRGRTARRSHAQVLP